jgi:hypothetical protein
MGFNQNKTTGANIEARAEHPTGAHDFIPRVLVGFVLFNFVFGSV